MCDINKICKLFLLLVLFSVDLSAQTATTVNGYPVIDLSAFHSWGAVLSSTEAAARRTEMNDQTPYSGAYMDVGNHISNQRGTWNAKMSGKFQVMRNDLTEEPINWTTAYNRCKNYDGEGGGVGQWRLPTQRELSMMWILHPQLIGKGDITPLYFNLFNSYGHWSATECTALTAWQVYFGDGSMTNVDKASSKCRVRCVRDL
ncbi:Lcl C-terminal domain-containing protein [Parabacteroides sp.]